MAVGENGRWRRPLGIAVGVDGWEWPLMMSVEDGRCETSAMTVGGGRW